MDDASKLRRRLQYLFLDRCEALALAAVAVGGVDANILEGAAWSELVEMEEV